MLNLPAATLLELPVDELALALLKDLIDSGTWSEWNYYKEAEQYGGYRGGAVDAIAEAFAWLRGRALIARSTSQSSDSAIFVTRRGREVAAEGVAALHATDRLGGVHPLIERRARRQFLLGEYEQAVFASMKAVEVRIRSLGGFPDDAIGVDLINRAFGPAGALTDPAAQRGEQEGTRALFAGAYALFRNPAGHREVDYDDIAEAAEAVQTASMLMRILDRVESRIQTRVTP